MRGFRLSGRGAAAAAACAMVMATAGTADAVGTPDDYLYRLDAVTSTEAVTAQNFNNRISYTTVSGSTRTVKISVRVPPGLAEQPRPVVIVAHGGGAQPNDRNPATTLPEWGEALARAGYVAVNVLHGTNELAADRIGLCQAIGFPVVADPSALAATLQHIAADVVGAASSGGAVSVNVADLIAAHPGLFEHLDEIVDEAAEESPLVAQVVDILMGRLAGCTAINGLGLWDRPYDIAAVVNGLHDGLLPELEGWMDLTKVAVLGHSNGTASVLNAVGMQRALPNGIKVPAPFPAGHARRPVAAVALSPMGVNNYGHFDTAAWVPGMTDSKEHSWVGLTEIPVLTVTGDGDNHCKTRYVCSGSDSAGKRRIPFERMPAGDKYLMFVADQASTEIVSNHELFGSLDGPGTCRSPSLAAECASTVRWIKSAALAFLDAYVLEDRRARSWLRSRRLLRASGGIAGIERK
jgi:hypothetical protein